MRHGEWYSPFNVRYASTGIMRNITVHSLGQTSTTNAKSMFIKALSGATVIGDNMWLDGRIINPESYYIVPLLYGDPNVLD